MTSSPKSLEEKIEYGFQCKDLLIEALNHPSYAVEKKTEIRDNQRLEFLGDAVVQIIVTKKIFHLFPDLPEGKLTKIRSSLTKKSALALLAKTIGLGDHLRLGHGEKINEGYKRDSMLCDAFEALIGAVYVDCNNQVSVCEILVNRLLDQFFSKNQLQDLLRYENPKGKLQEWSQKEHSLIPEYSLIETIGPDHDKLFKVNVLIKNECLGTGEGGKRQIAEEQAAQNALAKINNSQF